MDAQLRPNPVCKAAEAYTSGVGNAGPSLLVEIAEAGGSIIMLDFDNLDAIDAFIWTLQRGRDSLIVLQARVDAARVTRGTAAVRLVGTNGNGQA